MMSCKCFNLGIFNRTGGGGGRNGVFLTVISYSSVNMVSAHRIAI